MRILYADTDEMSQVNFVNVMKGNTSWSAQYAVTREAVRQTLTPGSFDLVIADLSFIDIVLEITSCCTDIAIIAIGEVEDLSQVEHLFSKGVAQYLKKPFYTGIIQQISKEIENSPQVDTEDIAIRPDFSYLDRLTKGRTALKIDLMEIYLTVVAEELINTAEGSQEKDIKRIGDSAHRMKSNVRMMGLKVIMDRLDEIENLVRSEACDATFYELVKSTSELLELTLVKVKAQVDKAKTMV